LPQSAFIVRVPQAEACVGELRTRFDPSAGRGVPAHITVLMPFMAPQRIGAAVLAQIRAALDEVPSFRFTLASLGRFPAVAYLAPEPAEPFIALTNALVRRIPDFPPFGGQHSTVIPHLTIAQGNADDAEFATAQAQRWLAAHGPIRAACTSVVLLEDSSGHWREMHEFTLADDASSRGAHRPSFSADLKIRIDDLSGPEIRALLEEHLAEMRRQSPPESVHALDLEALRHPAITFWTVWSGGALAGCAALKELDPSHGEIKSMRTAFMHRRKGVARAALAHLIEEARRRRYRRLSLETGSNEPFEPARLLYASFGFSDCAPFADYAADPNSVFMTRLL
jgi:putative acetyltransferase